MQVHAVEDWTAMRTEPAARRKDTAGRYQDVRAETGSTGHASVDHARPHAAQGVC